MPFVDNFQIGGWKEGGRGGPSAIFFKNLGYLLGKSDTKALPV